MVLALQPRRTPTTIGASTRKLGLSLGDRACLALAKRLRVPAYTADRAWAAVQVPGIVVRTVR
jgi:PIN domain nuclease of toxin-antitoxin system